MLPPRYAVWLIVVSLIIVGTGVVFAQEYPNKPIRIVTDAAGGGNDIASRIIAQALTGSLEIALSARDSLTPAQVGHARKLVEASERPAGVAHSLGVSRATLYRAFGRET